MQDVKYLTTLDGAKALSDPFRYKILNYFYKINNPATVKQVADEMKEVPAKVHYHVKKMEKAGILELIRTEEINGIVAKYYYPTAEDFQIRLSQEYDKLQESNAQLMKTETYKMIAKLYDTNKNEILEHLNKRAKQNKKEKLSLSMQDLYLTEQEAEEFSKYVFEFLNKHKSLKKDSSDIKKYNTFFSIMKLSEDEDK